MELCVRAYLHNGIATYGLEEIHTALQNICKRDYDFLKTLYGKEKPLAQQVPFVTQEEEIPRPESQKLRGDAKVRVVKKPCEEVPELSSVAVLATLAHAESGFSDPKDIKKWQKDQEDKKKRELDAQGINPASLLTKENLQKWIVDEKKTFAFVAREYVGLPDSMVASSAKSFGIQSENSKRRAMIAARKRK
jgi:hypothetical protein